MKICSVCGKVLHNEQELCPNGHDLPADAAGYVKELQRTGAAVTLKTINGLTSSGQIELVTQNGFYLFSSTVVNDPLLYSWDEIDEITVSPNSRTPWCS